jgi:Domain of unknown function (DUF4189)
MMQTPRWTYPDIGESPGAGALGSCGEAKFLGHYRYDMNFLKLSKMRATRSIAISMAVMAMLPLSGAVAGDRFDIAQAPMGSHERYKPPLAQPNADPLPSPSLPGQPAPVQPDSSPDDVWGAIGFTADGSYSTVWKAPSKAEAEAEVAKKCSAFGRGGCQVVSFSGKQCGALATYIGNYKRRRWNLSFTAGGETYPEAQNAALERCNSDERSQGRCTSRIAACADGR